MSTSPSAAGSAARAFETAEKAPPSSSSRRREVEEWDLELVADPGADNVARELDESITLATPRDEAYPAAVAAGLR